MRTRRSYRNQDRLYRDIGRQLARSAVKEADPEIYACPDGASCQDPECPVENRRRQAAREDAHHA